MQLLCADGRKVALEAGRCCKLAASRARVSWNWRSSVCRTQAATSGRGVSHRCVFIRRCGVRRLARKHAQCAGVVASIQAAILHREACWPTARRGRGVGKWRVGHARRAARRLALLAIEEVAQWDSPAGAQAGVADRSAEGSEDRGLSPHLRRSRHAAHAGFKISCWKNGLANPAEIGARHRRASTENCRLTRRDRRSLRHVFTSSPFPASATGRKNGLTPWPDSFRHARLFLLRCGVAPTCKTGRRTAARPSWSVSSTTGNSTKARASSNERRNHSGGRAAISVAHFR